MEKAIVVTKIKQPKSVSLPTVCLWFRGLPFQSNRALVRGAVDNGGLAPSRLESRKHARAATPATLLRPATCTRTVLRALWHVYRHDHGQDSQSQQDTNPSRAHPGLSQGPAERRRCARSSARAASSVTTRPCSNLRNGRAKGSRHESSDQQHHPASPMYAVR